MNPIAADVSASDLPPVHSVSLGSHGPTVVMLHGWGRSLQLLRPLGEILATSCRVLLVDLPGFGRSPLPLGASNDGGGWSTAQYSERVRDFLIEKGISSCVVVGHSFGGRITVRLAAAYPELVQAAVLIGTPGVPRERSLAERAKISAIKLLVSVSKQIDSLTGTRIFAHYFAPRFGSTDYKAAGELRKTFVKTVNENLTQLARTVKAPTLLLWGANDREAPVDQAHTYSRLLPKSELHIFPDKGHEPFSDVGAHLLVRYIESFLNTQGLLP